MPSRYLPYVIAALAAAVAALAFLPYSWAHIAAGSLSAALAVLQPANSAVIHMQAKFSKKS